MGRSSTLIALSFVVAMASTPALAERGATRKTTLDRTIVAEGERDLAFGPGIERVTRRLGWRARGTGRPLAGFKQASDVHAVDEESPGRVEFFDMCDPTLSSAYRPHEAMSTQIADSMLTELARHKKGPATGTSLDFTIATGDNVDNNQRNELLWFISLMNGEEVDPNSGGPAYDGYTQTEFSEALDLATLELAQTPFQASGAGTPWYAVLGNHDGLIQGNIPFTLQFQLIVRGGTKPFVNIEEYEGCPEDPSDFAALEAAFTDAYLNHSRTVPSDPLRQFLARGDIIDEYLAASGAPRGHGFRNAPDDPLDAEEKAGYYAFDVSERIIGLSLDTIAADSGASGQMDDHQFKWLKRQLKRHSRRYYSEGGDRKKNKKASNKLIMIFSHHSSQTLDNPGSNEEAAPYHCFEPTDADGCENGEGLRSLLHRFPNAIAWVNGHEHNNAVRGFPAAAGTDPSRGFWEINTASHIDWPQQSRLIEVSWKPGANRTADSVMIFATTVDHGAPIDPDSAVQDPTEYLASLARVEAFYDACVRTAQAECGAGGSPSDQNVKLVLKAPFDLGK